MTYKKHLLGQSFGGYVREHLADIEGRLSVGERYTALHKGFVKLGFDVTLDTMRGAIYRARLARDGIKSRKAGGVGRAGKLKAAATVSRATGKGAGPGDGGAGEGGAAKPAKDYFARESVFSTTRKV